MIYAKTGMGRMPSNCDGCNMFVHDLPYPDKCAIKDKLVNAHNGRPSWCPLQELFPKHPSSPLQEKKHKEIEHLTKQYIEEIVELESNSHSFLDE